MRAVKTMLLNVRLAIIAGCSFCLDIERWRQRCTLRMRMRGMYVTQHSICAL